MALALEACFYTGVVMVLIGIVSACICWFRSKQRLPIPFAIFVLGIALVVGPGIVTRNLAVDLGPRDTMVQGERHVTLTGWDEESYAFLKDESDIVVLQMANSDVTDETLRLLRGHRDLRELDINESQVTDAGLAVLAALPNLASLKLRGTKITDEGFQQHLLPLTNLNQVDLRDTAVTPESVDQWQSAKEGRRALR